MRLKEFVRAAWVVLNPNTPYYHGRHIDAICDLLEAITYSNRDPNAPRNAIINIPPRHMKSFLVSVFWPCWVWTFRPESQWMFTSYAEPLAIRDSLRCRRLIGSPWYQANWGHLFQLTGDQNEKKRFENDHGGYRIITTPGGVGTGDGGDFIVVDDPHKAQDAHSPAELGKTCAWWDGTMSTRGNDPKTVCKVVVMQRLAQADLTGHLIDAMTDADGEKYELLILPAEYEQTPGSKGRPWSDWRGEKGELLWPERFARADIRRLAKNLGNEAPGQLQQRPAAEGGAIYDVRWWGRGKNRYALDAPPPDGQSIIARYLFLDTAFKEKQTNDFSACLLVELLSDWRICVRPLWKERLTLPKLVRKVAETARDFYWLNGDAILYDIVIEDKASGTSAIQTIRESCPEWLASRIAEFMPFGDKVYRAQQASNWCSLNCVLLPRPHRFVPTLMQMLREIEYFPGVPHDEWVDTLSMAILYLEHYIAQGWQARNVDADAA